MRLTAYQIKGDELVECKTWHGWAYLESVDDAVNALSTWLPDDGCPDVIVMDSLQKIYAKRKYHVVYAWDENVHSYVERGVAQVYVSDRQRR